jgi:hypothetical protein
LYGDVQNLDLVGAPTLAAYPKISLLSACEFWKRGEPNDPAAQDDIVTITRRINGGLNRLDSRGQRLSISQSDRTETNIVFQLYQPPWPIGRAEDGVEIAGRALRGATEGAHARHWSGVLPRSPTWGGGEYRLRLVLR